jgi:tetratricopeptide (TPR) repeat protein
LLSKARSLVSQCDYELGVKFIERVLHRRPDHVEARELLGVIQVEVGEVDLARQTFSSLIPPSPTAPPIPPPSAYLYLAQLADQDPRAALAHYQSAVDIFVTKLDPSSPSHVSKQQPQQQADEDEESEVEPETVEDVKRDLVRALIAMVEIWMDPEYDLCFDPAAPSTCESLLNLALHTDPNNAEAQQCLASVRLSQDRAEDALSILLHAYSIWKDHIPPSSDTDALDANPSSTLDPTLIPPIPTRLALTKMFLELARYTEALEVIQSVMGEDDEEVEAWYLEGWCFWLMAEKAKESGGCLRVVDGATGKESDADKLGWKNLAKDARDGFSCWILLQLHVSTSHPDTPLLQHAQELIAKLQEMGVEKSPEDDGEEWGGINADDEDQWEDDDEAEDVEMK